MVYKFKAGSMISADPEKAAAVLNQLADENRLNAETVVEVSRPEDAPLHNEFEWRDDVAAEEWRKHQARHIIGCLVIVDEEKTPEPVKAFYKINDATSNYEPIHTIIKTEDKTEALKKLCLKEFLAFKAKYATVLKFINANEQVNALQVTLEQAVGQ